MALVLGIACFILAGVFWSFFNLREYDEDNVLRDTLYELGLLDWYTGGEGYNQGFIFGADFKHVSIILRHFFYYTAGFLMGCWRPDWIGYGLTIVGGFLAGWVFVALTHYVLTYKPAGDWKHYVLRQIMFWK